MYPRLITQKIHALIDYPVAIALIALPFLFGLGASNPVALWLSVGTGLAALILTLFTDHQLGVFRVLSYGYHRLVDFLVGVTFLLAPVFLGFSGLDAWYYWANGAAVVLVVSLHKPDLQPVCLGSS